MEPIPVQPLHYIGSLPIPASTSMKRNPFNFSVPFVLIGLLFSCSDNITLPETVAVAMEQLTAPVDYTYDVKPILSDRCFACHGPDANKVKADLRLDVAKIALHKKSDNGLQVIAPGKPGASELVHRILSSDPDLMMPTPDSHLSLSDHEKAILIKWIKEGAAYQPHWAFTAIEKPPLPAVTQSEWPRNPVDYFILAKLEATQRSPLPEADKTTLLRRVFMDITGLPPSPDQVNDFLNDQSPDAYEKVVDRLLASPHYGEHMAVSWLDAARYADTHGYQDDMMRTAWPYRDWVIKAFNDNLPYDQFVTWQLAGDLLPNPTREQMVATAFNRMHQQSMEGGIIEEEYRTEYVADRVNTFGITFLGLTTECARCHDHKYDPISQKDYFSLYAFFNNINENGQIPYNGEASPSITLPTPEADKQLQYLQQQLSAEEKKRLDLSVALQPAFTQWLENARQQPLQYLLPENSGLYGHFSFDEPAGKTFQNLANPLHQAYSEGDDSTSNQAVRPGKFGNSRYMFGENSVDFGKDFAYFERNQPFTVSIWLNIKDPGLSGSLIHKSNHITSGFRGWNLFHEKDGTLRLTLSHVWPDNSIELVTRTKITPNQWTHVAFSYDGLSKARGTKIYLNGNEIPTTVYNDNLTQSILYGKHKTNITVNNLKIGRLNDRFTKDFEVDELKIYTRNLSPLELRSLFSQQNEVSKALTTRADQDNPSLLPELEAYYLANMASPYKKSLEKSLDLLGRETEILNEQIDVMVMKERRFPRTTHILERGVYDAPGKEVTPDTPDSFFKLPGDYPRNRLGLARWLTHPDHPLFSRVVVNRFWHHYFGKGIVSSISDFGNQGNLPTHPALLDWLAAEFRGSGKWNVKALQKLLVMSATYRQASTGSREQLESDPDNNYYARGPSYRMAAEQIRDNALVASRLFNPQIGGESVYPYQPDGIWEAISNYGKYKRQTGDTLYRRSMYTVWKRTAPPPMMLNFDAAERHFCTVKRQTTSTPLQALVLMNDPQFVEAARVLAQKILADQKDLYNSISHAYLALCGRPPRKEEMKILQELYLEELEHFKQHPRQSKALLQVGDYPVAPQLATPELAALTVVTSTVMNFDEFTIKR